MVRSLSNSHFLDNSKRLKSLFRALTFFSFILFTSLCNSPLNAQEANFDERLENALNAPYPGDQIRSLQLLIESETEAKNQIIAGYWASEISKELKLYDQAAEYAVAAITLADKKFSSDLQLRDTINDQLIEVYFLDDETDKATAAIDSQLKLNDANLSRVWSSSQEGVLHRYSELYCPNRIGGLYREETHIFHPVGNDVGCTYKEYNGENNVVTLYLTRENYEVESRTPHKKAMDAVRMNWENAEALTDTKVLQTKTGVGTDITETLLRSGSVQRGYDYTGTWTSDVEGWTLKSRVTWSGSLGEKFGRKHATALLSDPTAKILEHLRVCQSISFSNRIGQKVPNSAALSLEALALIANERMREVNDTAAPLPETGCIQEISKQGNAVVESYPSGALIYGIVGEAIEGRVYLMESPELAMLNMSKGPEYSFRREFTDDKGETIVDVIGLYDEAPSPRQLLVDYISILNGEAKVLGRYTEDNEKNTTLNVFTKEKVDE